MMSDTVVVVNAPSTPSNVIVQSGATGPQGPQGPQGAAGANGTNGTNGTNGATGVSISASPPSTSQLWADINDNPIGYTYNVVAKTANYTVLATDEIVTCNTSGGAFNLTLPAASTCKGRRFFFKKTNTGANKVTLIGTIEADTNPTLGPGVDDVTIFSDGSNFYYWGF